MMTSGHFLDVIVGVVRQHLPVGLSPRDLDSFLDRNRGLMEAHIQRSLGPLLARLPGPSAASTEDPELPELWTAGKRTAANLAAMALAARLESERRAPTAQERLVLRGYSGWGGLSIEGAASKFPSGFPVPEARGLIHEYYTPSKVAAEIARVVQGLLPTLPDEEGVIHALEPSAGIGRMLAAFSGSAFDPLVWHAVEWSELSGRMLKALYPRLDLVQGPFERWVRERAATWAGRLHLVVSNPPYGARGAAIAEDPDRTYREKRAYAYFLRRALDLLAPNGLGVFLIPSGFLTANTVEMRGLREQVLKRHHLAAAFRLPSVKPGGREALFPGAMLVTDLLFWRARGGELPAVDSADEGILEGAYFREFPWYLLGRELGRDAGDDDQTKKPRYGYQVEGAFTRLPRFDERPICAECRIFPLQVAGGKGPRVGVTRQVQDDTAGLPDELAAAVTLGLRVDRYLALVAAGNAEEPAQLWSELHEALRAWVARYGNPTLHAGLLGLVRRGTTGAERFLSAFTKTGTLIPGLLHAPPKPEPRYTGRPDDVVAQAELLYRSGRALSVADLWSFHEALGGPLDRPSVVRRVLAGGWCLDGESWTELVPPSAYYTGDLWPKHDRASARAKREAVALSPHMPVEAYQAQAAAQARKLLETIAPAVFDDIDGVSPRQGWVPMDLTSAWINEMQSKFNYPPLALERKNGLVLIKGWEYEGLDKKHTQGEIRPETLLLLGWMNHDKTLFSPPKEREGETDKDIDKRRLAKAAEWDAAFKGWAGATPERRQRIEDAYNRQFRGYVAPSYSVESLPIARWKKDGPRLHPHQVAGARRVLSNGGGMVAFDVGVGKTYTGIAILARARQEGWVKRPVILVPNSIVWKWYADILRVLPDYRVAVVGSKQKVMSRGPRKGLLTSETDSPTERAEKWTRFQAGEYDVVLLTYSMLGRTRMNEAAVRSYADQVEAIQREVALRQRNAAKRKKQSEREQAILKEGVAAWVAQQMELGEDESYDPGVAFDDIGVDMLIIDEAQNFKNLYLPEEREGGVPRYMGNPGDGSKRAWQLDFRCAAIRRKTGGRGVVLLSATPAKNSPLEFYSLIQYIDPDAWTRMGIRDPEQFIDRYLRIEMRSVVNPKLEIEDRSAVVGFQNLHELRDVIFRYGDFKTAEEVGLKLPEPRVEMVEVDMDDAQSDKYDRYVRQIETALQSTDPQDRAQILGLMARLALVAIHSELDQGFEWDTADRVADPSSPKFEALADRVMTNKTCGHIVFVDNVAAHRWVRDVLVERGIKIERIGILNAKVASAAADRQRIAKEFNGDPETGTEPKYDIVIANQIAYEGIDLQTRTCAIHHLDLPWEPATLQQRNGRGVRQGNTLSAIAIYYYFARKSQDGLRFNLIQGKRGWMTQLLKSQDRDTNNPGAQMDVGPEEILLLISRDPEKTRKRMDEVRKRREAEAKAKIATEASRLLRAINARFRMAERSKDATEAARLRGEAEARLKDLARVSPDAWPWAGQAAVVRERPVLVPEGGGPVYEGLRVAIPSTWGRDRVDHIEFGRVTREGGIGLRIGGGAAWEAAESTDARLSLVRPEHIGAGWPTDDEARTVKGTRERLDQAIRYSADWSLLGWHLAPDAWAERMWGLLGADIVASLGTAPSYVQPRVMLPVVGQNGLRIVNGQAARTAGLTVLPPTHSGWSTFLAMAPTSGLTFTQLQDAARFWWSSSIPRDLLSANKDGANTEMREEAA